MNVRWNLIVVALLATVLGFLLEGAGPIGKVLWPPAAGTPVPAGANLALLMVEGGLEAVAFGVGAAFLVAAYPWAKANAAGSRALSWATYGAVAWVLMNWVFHTAMHMHHGNILVPADFGGLVAIEYGFHVTLMGAGAILATYCIRSMASRAPRTASHAEKAPAKNTPM